ncbi:MAG: hypothetical protein COA78_06575 [Blastopirellula sp.]|nr:MAG: hypothetical protein COA78_06575 [Blastopirellula sp.]
MQCYITQTASYLPGPAVENEDIQKYLGTIDGDAEVMPAVLSMNGILTRHYAQDQQQQKTHDVYGLGANAVHKCLAESQGTNPTYLATGTTYSPLAAPGFASILHSQLQDRNVLNHPVEISSHSGICSSAATAMVGAIRAVSSGQHDSALCVGAEHASEVLKASKIRPVDDRDQHTNLRNSQWFMSVFLRFMLSDGAGAFLLENKPSADRLSLKVNWTHSQSYAHETPLCMQLDNSTAQLSQDISVLSRHLVPSASQFLNSAIETNQDDLDSYTMVLPHMSSFFFRRKMERVIARNCADPDNPVPYWTNLATAGNTGAASIYLMLDEFIKQHDLSDGDRLLLFVPESGQFNYVMVSLTVVLP